MGDWRPLVSKQFWLPLFLIGWLAAGVSPRLLSGQSKARFYEKKESWHETMVSSRNLYFKWYEQQPVQKSPWFISNLSLEEVGDEPFLDIETDLTGRTSAGEPLWQQLPRTKDDVRYAQVPAKGSELVYLACVLTAREAVTLPVEIGCSRDAEVYLNGQRFSERTRLRMPPKPTVLNLPLRAGENRIVLKAFNENPRIIDFTFSFLKNPAVEIWTEVEEDFPLEATRFSFELGDGGHLDWFEQASQIELERQIIEQVLAQIGASQGGLRTEFDQLFQSPSQPADPKYLAFYERLCRVRHLSEDLKKISFRALRMGIEDLTTDFPEQYPHGTELLREAGNLEKQKEVVARMLLEGTEASIGEVSQFCSEVEQFKEKALLANPLLDFSELLLIKRRPQGNPYWFREASRGIGKFIGLPQQSSWQLHKMSNTFDWENEIVSLSPVRPEGKLKRLYAPPSKRLISEMDLHFSGNRVLISMPDDQKMWQLYEIDIQTGKINQLTGEAPDVHSLDGCYLPNGKIAFVSTACFQGVPCNAGVNVGMLYLMEGDGSNIRQLCFEQDHNFCPTVMNDGRVLYLRWEYTDVPHVWARYLFTMNPDGSGQRPFYGTGSYWPNAIFYARPIPGHPSKVAGIVTGHHVGRVGELVVFDPAQSRYSAEGVVQRIPGYGEKVKPLIQDKLTEEVYPKFLHPYPLSEKYFLVSCRPTREDLWGIYLVDTFDNMTLIKEVEDYALVEPLPLQATQKPPAIPDMIDLNRQDAVVYIENVYEGRGLKGVPKGSIEKLRLFTYHFAYRTVAGIAHRVGADGPWEPKRILGTVPVEKDGSALFRVPANTPISIQPLDSEGKAVQLMRSWMTAMPGEVVSCVGCHEEGNSSPLNRTRTIALNKTPEEIRPWYGAVRGFSFVREVQPVLDKYCVGCHDGTEENGPDLRRDQGKFIAYKSGIPEPVVVHDVPMEKLVTKYGGVFPPAYIELRRFVRVGGLESDIQTLPPGEFHADGSELFQLLNKGHYGVTLDAEATERLAAWIDLNAPCHGTWEEVVGAKKIANDHARREDLRARYAQLYDDYETIASPQKGPSVAPTLPKPAATKTPQVFKLAGWPFGSAQAKYLQANGQEITRTVDLGGGVQVELVYIPAGEFVMGDPQGEHDESPAAAVSISQPFWISKFEITNEQFARFDSTHDSRFEHKGSWMFNEWDLGWDLNRPRQPVVRISQQQASAFASWLSRKLGEPVDLPTEAQWEYACRSGSDDPFYFGKQDGDFSQYANLADWTIRNLVYDVRDNYPPDLVPRDSRFNDGQLVSADVGSFKPNSWGVYDMHGNVWEWTRTRYQPYPYDEADGRNSDLSATSEIVVRGGSWYDRPTRARSGFRLSYPAWRKLYNVGFRIVIPAAGQGLQVAGQ